MTLEGLKRELEDYGWAQNGIKWKKDGRVFTVHDDGYVDYRGVVSLIVHVTKVLLGYGTNVLEIHFKNETVEVQL